MTEKIFRSIILTAVIVLIGCFIAVATVQYGYFTNLQRQELTAELNLAAPSVERDGLDYLESLEDTASRVTWVAADGRVLFDSDASADEMGNHADRSEIAEALETGSGESERYSATMTEKTLYMARRLADGSVLRVSSAFYTILTVALGSMQAFFAILLAAIAVSVLLARRLSRRIITPLNTLDLQHPLDNDAYEELSPLLKRIDQQNRRIEAQVAELKRRQDEFSAVTRSMNEGLVLLNAENHVLSLNPAAMRLFNAGEDCVGRDFVTVSRDVPVTNAVRDALSAGRGAAQLERGERIYQIECSRIESDGAILGVALVAFDTTERAQAEQMKREFTANVSHELKTPLQSIMGSAELLENGLVKSEDQPRFIERIRSEAARLMALIEDIIRLSELDEGAAVPMEAVDLLSIAKDAADTLQESANKKNVTLALEGESAPIQGAPRLIYEIAYNLCDNAIRYNRAGGHVSVRVQPENGYALLEVADDGIGIPEEHQRRVFERFYRVDKSHSRASGGTGLGLSIVKHAAALHHAEIELKSEVGKGTTIAVCFPME
ncbi:MAG: ATP-binding protein [Clostridiales bacterium]|nr:ATP-binding protein [Clostridiales bacterium]